MSAHSGRGSARRLHHYDVNVHDLEATIAFLRTTTTFAARDVRRDRAPFLRDGAGAGEVEHVLLHNTAGPDLPALHLLRWADPPAGTPHTSPGAVGFFRIVVHSTDLERARADVRAAGALPFAPTTGDAFRFAIGSRGIVPFAAFACHDPNGIVIEFVAGPTPRLSVVAQGTRHLGAASRLLVDALGLERYDTVRTLDPTPDIYRPDGDTVRFRGHFLRAPGDPHGYVDLLQFSHPAPTPAYPHAHHIGVARAAFEVDDLDAAWSRVLGCAERLTPEYPPTPFHIGGPARVAGFRDAEGVRYQLLESNPANTS